MSKNTAGTKAKRTRVTGGRIKGDSVLKSGSAGRRLADASGKKTMSVRELDTQKVAIRAKADAVVAIAGSKVQAARMLGVARTQPGQWISGEEAPSDDSWQRLVDLEYVMSRVALVWHPEMVTEWLSAPNAFLDGAKPIDVLRLRGPSEVIDAVNAEAAGSYA